MRKHIKEIEHNGETYYALSSIIEILEMSNDLTHFDILLSADDELYQLYKDDNFPRDDNPCDDNSPFNPKKKRKKLIFMTR